jgi:Divergent InlB B-repeat domain
LAFSNPYKKYLVYYDGPVQEENICGTAAGRPADGPSYAIVYIRACGADPLGEGALWADVAVHELVHALGVVPPGAPNACADGSGHVCDSNADLMFPSTMGQPLEAMFLDVGRNDYYGHAGSWFDLQDSGWLARLDVPLHPLTVTIEGGGIGRVDSDLPGIECPPACAIPWEAGTHVLLRARPAAGSRWAGWSGPCSVIAAPPGIAACAVPMNAPTSVTARFIVPATLALRVIDRGGSGSIVSEQGPVDCADVCSVEFESGQLVRLRAVPDPGSRFLAWGGACAGRGVCTLTVAAGQTVTAAFGRASFRVNVRKTGQGRVTSRPAGISCGSRCAATFRAGTAVRLVARAAPGWRFTSWSGACRGRGACVVRATADRAVRATFRR